MFLVHSLGQGLSVTDICPYLSLLCLCEAHFGLFLDGLISLCRDSSADQDERGRETLETLFTHLLIFSCWCLPPEQSSCARRANAESTTKHTQSHTHTHEAESKTNQKVLWKI